MSAAPSPDPPRPLARSRALAILAGGVIVLLTLGGLWAWWAGRPAPSPPDDGPEPAAAIDPRLTYPTPYKNVRPEVKYVGDAVCAGCHGKESESYAQHPMGRALAPVSEATPIESYGPGAFDPFTAGGLGYGVRRDKDRAFHREWLTGEGPKVEIELEARFAVGSGARARSYALGRDGYLFQSPLTWYTHGKRWDLAPGYEGRNQHFSRAIGPGCLFCHCNYADHVEGTLNRYRAPVFRGYPIGCERCHGPGELHVRRHRAGGAAEGLDDTIVNPKRLDVPLRDAVCEQCHLQGEQRVVARGRDEFDYRPGLPLHLFLMDFVNAGERRGDHKFVSAVEQMRVSRCYVRSRPPKKLGCASCHDPHKAPAPAEKVRTYRDACQKCHEEKPCTESPARRREEQDSCVACHMPRITTEVNHTSSTDHRVPLRPPKGPPAKAPPRPTPGPDDLVPFHGELIAAGDEELSRDRGLALMAMLDRRPPASVAKGYAEKALPLLDRAVRRDADDAPAWRSRADALWLLGRPAEARSAYETVLAKRPGWEVALRAAGDLALEMNRLAEARGYFERAVKINPYHRAYHHGLAVASFRRGEWSRSARECAAALKLEPTNAATRSLLVQCQLCLGERDKAKAEYETILRLTPEEKRYDLGVWYEEQVRRLAP
jgi:predicted CXXCH cytochrome family protein